jgi:hypothetical protein
MTDPKRELLRHTVATLAYRGSKTIRGSGEEFGRFTCGPSTRTPLQILAHIGDLLEWGLSLAKGEQIWRNSTGESWSKEAERFHTCLDAFDQFLASDAELKAPVERLFQGPIADALTHVGQIAMMRRLADTPMRGENYYVAEITTGLTGPDQPPPRREFG